MYANNGTSFFTTKNHFHRRGSPMDKINHIPLPYQGYELARAILQKKFITPEDTSQTMSVKYSKVLLRQFEESLPSETVLWWSFANDYILVPGPPKPLSLMEIRNMEPDFFDQDNSAHWYTEEAISFSRNDKAKPGWIMLFQRELSEGRISTKEDFFFGKEPTPNAAEAAWALIVYKKISDRWAYGGYGGSESYVMTSSRITPEEFREGSKRPTKEIAVVVSTDDRKGINFRWLRLSFPFVL
jgi:hypothetical protein